MEKKVVCPICSGEAEDGFLSTGGRSYGLVWETGQPGFKERLRNFFRDGVPVGKWRFGVGYTAKGIYCRNCGQITLKVDQDMASKYYPYLKQN